jgi:hypothetical protein
MQPAKDPFASDGIRLSAAMARIRNREEEGTDRREHRYAMTASYSAPLTPLLAAAENCSFVAV